MRERKKAAAAAAREAADGAASDAPEDPSVHPPEAGAEELGEPGEYGAAVRQARGVMWACAALIFMAVTIELLRFGG